MSDPTTPRAHLEVDAHAPDRNLALELVRVTEVAAMAAGRWVGRGDKNGAGDGSECDVAVDPVDGTTLVAKGMNNVAAVMAVSARNHAYSAIDFEHAR